MAELKQRACKAPLAPAPGMQAPVRAGELAVVVGAGASGRAAAQLLAALGARVRLLDRDCNGFDEALRAEAAGTGLELLCGPHEAGHFSGAALVVTSPAIPPAVLAPLLRAAGDPPCIAEMELALRYVRQPVLAVTGTSGKTTTVSLAAAMLEASGKRVFLGGNIGTPLSDYVLAAHARAGEEADVLVLELSSFQLQGIASLRPRAAVLLNLAPNHLDHHRDMEEYSDAKFRLFALQGPEDLALLPEELVAEYRRRGCAARVELFGPAARFSRTRLIGRHNAANAEAAYLACRAFGVSEAEAARAVADFVPLRHRLEPAGELDGVLYVNDSKCTTVEAMRAALTSFDAPVLLLAGGKFKGGDLASLIPLLRERVKAVGLFGASRNLFETAWQGATPLFWDGALPEAVRRLRALAAGGDVVLLSPATASYDAYTNYKERGDHFCAIVHAMRAEGEQNGASGPAGEGT